MCCTKEQYKLYSYFPYSGLDTQNIVVSKSACKRLCMHVLPQSPCLCQWHISDIPSNWADLCLLHPHLAPRGKKFLIRAQWKKTHFIVTIILCRMYKKWWRNTYCPAIKNYWNNYMQVIPSHSRRACEYAYIGEIVKAHERNAVKQETPSKIINVKQSNIKKNTINSCKPC